MADAELWSLYASFLAVIRSGSLSAAARTLRLSQPTLGRHIEALERRLGGQPLFLRSPRGLVPTETAEALRPYIEAMASAAEAAKRAASAPPGALSGRVRISASEIVGGEVLPHILSEMRRAHPGLVFELSLSNDVEDLLRRDADIAVRMAEPTQGALLALHIGQVPMKLYGHRSYLEANGMPGSLAELKDHSIIGFDTLSSFSKRAMERLNFTAALFTLRTDNDLAGLAALRAGFGLSMCQQPLAERSGDFVAVLPDQIGLKLDIWIVMHEDLKRVRRIKAVFDALATGMRRYLAGRL